jgi:hypothetical protein
MKTLNEQQKKVFPVYSEKTISTMDDFAKYLDWYANSSGRVSLFTDEEDGALDKQAVVVIRGMDKALTFEFSVHGRNVNIDVINTPIVYQAITKCQHAAGRFFKNYSDSLRNCKIDTEKLFSEIMKAGESILFTDFIYANLYKKVIVTYVDGVDDTFGVYPNKMLKRWIMEVKKSFLIDFVASYLLLGFKNTNYTNMENRSYSTMSGAGTKETKQKIAYAASFLLRHEMDHILATTHREESVGFSHEESNTWQDGVINFKVTRFMPGSSGEMDEQKVPINGVGRGVFSDSVVDGEKFLDLRRGSVTLDSDSYSVTLLDYSEVMNFLEKFEKGKSYKLFLYMNPALMYNNVEGVKSTSHVMSFYRIIRDYFESTIIVTNTILINRSNTPTSKPKPPKKKEGEESEVPTKKVNLHDIIRSESTKEVGVVEGVDPVTKKVKVRVLEGDEKKETLEQLGVK